MPRSSIIDEYGWQHTGCGCCSVAPLPSAVSSAAATAPTTRDAVGPVRCAALVGPPRRFREPPLALQRHLWYAITRKHMHGVRQQIGRAQRSPGTLSCWMAMP